MADPIPPDSPASPIQADSQGSLFLPYRTIQHRGKAPVSVQDPILEIVNENGVTTVTVQDQHGLCVGDIATIGGTVNTNLSGAFQITAVPTPFMLQYNQSPAESPWPPPSDRLKRKSDTKPIPPTPPIQGATDFVGKVYGYFVLPYVAIPPQDSQPYLTFYNNPRATIEGMLLTKQLYSEKVILITGQTAYRIPVQYLWLLKYDRYGPYIGNPPQIYQITTVDPTVTILPSGQWVPVW
jgi:hypothetical protein